MKILFTAIHPAPYVDQWLNNLRQKYIVHVFYNYEKSAAKQWENYVPESVILLKDIGILQWIKMLKNNDLVILSGWREPYNIFTLFVTLFLKIKVAVFSDYPIEIHKYTLKWLLKKLFLMILVRRILCATQSTQLYYQKVFGFKSSETFFFPYATVEAPDNYIINEERKKIILKDGHIRIFVANNFRERKGYKTLLEAFSKLTSDELSQIELTIAGCGELFDMYSSQIKDVIHRVSFLGWINDKEYRTRLKETDVFIHASNFEPFGIPPIDAMKYGKLIIASDGVKSIDRIVINKSNGLSFEAGNSQELSNCIKWTLLHKERIYSIGKKAREDVNLIYDNNFCNKIDF